MPNKYYVILYRASRNEMTFPIKAVNNEFNNAVQFAGGYPAIFGGTDNGGGPNATMIAEVTQESRGTLQAGAPFTLFYQGVVGADTLSFYSTTAWQSTGQAWGDPTNRDEGEMESLVTVSIDEFSSQDSPDEVLDKLIALSGATGGSQNQLNEFLQSETAAAFTQFIYNNVPNEDEEQDDSGGEDG